MRWRFSKKRREVRMLLVERQRWSVAQANNGGAPLLVRFNHSARDFVGDPNLPITLGFAIPLNRPHEGGRPESEENEQLLAIEDLIVTQVLAAGTGIHALTPTNGVMKECVFYVATDLDIAGLHASVREKNH